jgi:DNA-binding IclR family transcriptional regulator
MFGMENLTFDEPNRARRAPAPAVRQAARALEEVAASDGIGVSEIARRTGMSKSSAHGIISALVDEGLLSISGARTYSLGPRLLDLSRRTQDQRIRRAARDSLATLSSDTGETSLFGRLEGDAVAILAVQAGSRPLNVSAPVGSRIPLLAGALGKAYVGLLDNPQAASFLADHPLSTFTPRSETEPARYLCCAHAAAERGYATDDGEYIDGVAAAATAFSWLDEVYFVWAVALGERDLDDLGRSVRTAADVILRDAGGPPFRAPEGDL